MAAASKKLTMRHIIGNTLIDPTSVKFSSPSGTYGIKRVSDDTIVIADDSAVPRDADNPIGVFSYTLTATVHDIQLQGLVEGETYDYWWEWTYLGVTKWRQDQFVARTLVVTPVNLYTTYDRFKRRWGLKNIIVASNKDGKATEPDMESIQDSFDHATDEIHDALRGSIVAVPLVFNNATVSKTVENWVFVLAYSNLYDARGMEDTNKKGNKLSTQVLGVYNQINAVKLGLKQLDVRPNIATDGKPVSVGGSHVDAFGRCWRYLDGQLTCVRS